MTKLFSVDFKRKLCPRKTQPQNYPYLSEEKIKEILTFSNATAALTVCKRGAIGALPTKEEVLALAQGR